jgi:Arc/MetJ-type ribon-helix-helix transcriptional regulator
MNDKKVSVSLRMGIKDVQIMDDYLMEHPEFENVSHFIRTAVAKYIGGDAERTSQETTTGSGIYVRLSKMELAAIDRALQTGAYIDGEEFIRDSLRKTIAPKVDEQNGNLLETAQKLLL